MTDNRNPLTEMEKFVLANAARGLDNQEIADYSFRSVETIRHHIKGILRKLKARNRAHAVAIAYHTGIFGTAQTKQEEHAA